MESERAQLLKRAESILSEHAPGSESLVDIQMELLRTNPTERSVFDRLIQRLLANQEHERLCSVVDEFGTNLDDARLSARHTEASASQDVKIERLWRVRTLGGNLNEYWLPLSELFIAGEQWSKLQELATESLEIVDSVVLESELLFRQGQCAQKLGGDPSGYWQKSLALEPSSSVVKKLTEHYRQLGNDTAIIELYAEYAPEALQGRHCFAKHGFLPAAKHCPGSFVLRCFRQ